MGIIFETLEGLDMSIPIPKTGKIAIPGREGQFLDAQDLSRSPGGTVFGTTPGGSRIVYSKEFLLTLKDGPMSATPPKNMAKIPGVTAPRLDAEIDDDLDAAHSHSSEEERPAADDAPFKMDDE